MKGYCADVRGFSVDKKKLVVDAINMLTGSSFNPRDSLLVSAMGVLSVGPTRGVIMGTPSHHSGEFKDFYTGHLISFNDLMLEAGFNYEDNGVECFKWIDLPKCAITENKPPSNKTRPQITREQYDAVMAQSDKRTFTKALGDLLAVEKEQLLDEQAIRIKQLEGEAKCFAEKVISWRESWLKSHYAKQEIEAKLEKQKRKTTFVTFCLTLAVACQLAVILFQ